VKRIGLLALLLLLNALQMHVNAQLDAQKREKMLYDKWNPLNHSFQISKKRTVPIEAELALLRRSFEDSLRNLTSLVLIDRHPLKAIVLQVDSIFVRYRKPGSNKQLEIERDKVYGIANALGETEVVYLPDSLESNWLSANEMKDYIRGQQDAQRNYRIRPNISAAGGLMVGAVGSATGMFVGPLSIIAYTGLAGYTLPGQGRRSGFDQTMKENAAYREGYGTAAKRKTVKKAALWSSIGYVTGLAALTIVLNQ
jgi:hypothetical protein